MAIGYISSKKENLPLAWMRWIIPSTRDLMFVALLVLLVYTTLAVRLLGDAGIGWHIRTGQLILSAHAIPRVDPFSSTMSGRPWFAWEWLFDVLVGWLDRVAGLNGVVFFTASIIALTFSWTFRLLLRRGTSFPLALILVLMAASASMIHFFARPHVVSWLFSVLWFYILDSSEARNRASTKAQQPTLSLWLLPPLMLLWANIHGGFLLGFVLLGIYWLSAVWEYFRLGAKRFEDALQKIKAAKRRRQLAVIGILSALATLANPYGWRLHAHIYRYLSNRFLMDHIDEFQSPNFHLVAQKCFAALLMLTLVALAVKKRDTPAIRPSEALVLLFAIYSGLYASRNIPVSSLLLILVIGPRLTAALQTLTAKSHVASQSATSSDFFRRMQNVEAALHGHIWPIAAILLTFWITFHGGKLGTKPLINAHFDPKRFPAAAVNYLASRESQGPVFVPDSWGGYFIYRLYPQIKVAVDDRHDLYGEQFLKSYLKTMHVEPGWKDFLDQYPVRYVIIPTDSALANILAETPSWQPIYSDDVAVVFAPANPAPQ
jgi:hypothetical protein